MRSLLSPAQHSVWSALRRRPATPDTLARRLPHLARQTVARILRALVEQGLATRTVRTTWARLPERGTATYLYRLTETP